jgi:hypothetical protein
MKKKMNKKNKFLNKIKRNNKIWLMKHKLYNEKNIRGGKKYIYLEIFQRSRFNF